MNLFLIGTKKMKSVLSNLTGLQVVLGKTKAIADTLWH